MAGRELTYQEIFQELNEPLKMDSYLNMCMNMEHEEGLVGNEEFRKILKQKKKLIMSDEPKELTRMLKGWREEHDTPRDHYWWWIDQL